MRIGVLLCLWLGWAGISMAELPVNTRLGGDFTLPSTAGEARSLSDYRGKVVLLNFGFTACPDVCPMVISKMVALMKHLGDEADDVQPLFVTFDPERDTVQHLSRYLGAFDKRLVGFSGEPAALARVAEQYGVVVIPEKTSSQAGRLFTHSDFIYLLDRQGRVRALFGSDESIESMAEKVESLIEED